VPRRLGPEELATLEELASWAERELHFGTLERALADLDAGNRMFGVALDLLCVAGFDGYFKRLSPSWTRTLGWSNAELLARPFVDFIHPDDRASTEAEAARIAEGATTLHFRNRYATRGGEWRWLDWSAAPDREHGLIYASARDITQERELAAKVASSAAMHRTILDTATDAIITCDDGGRVRTANQAVERLLRWERTALEGQHLKQVLPTLFGRVAGAPSSVEAAREALDAQVGVTREVEARARDGRSVPMELATSRASFGSTTVFACALRDLTERRRTERLKSEFISTVSHELRTPLTSIRGSLGLVMGGAVGELPPKARTMLTIAQQNVERLVRLINDILDLEKISAGELQLQVRLHGLPRLLERAVEATRAMAEPLGVRLELDDDLPEAILVCDEDRIAQVMANLHSNAIKFSPRGGVVRTGASLLGQGSVRVWVSDEGPGIPVEFRPRIFERFTQADSTNTRAVSGSGLGLNITRAIVERHGGAIRFECPPGGGTRFEVDLPVMRGRSSGGVGRVALVAGAPRLDVEHMLRAAGYDPRAHAGGALPEDVALVVVDVEAPDASAVLAAAARLAVPVPTLLLGVGSAASAAGLVVYGRSPLPEDSLAGAVRGIAQGDRRPLVLHVEDDPDVQEIVRSVLAPLAAVRSAGSIAEARVAVREQRPDLMVLDLALPDGCGLVLLDDGALAPVPVVVFSARELPPSNGYLVSAALLKSRASNDELLGAVRAALHELGGRVYAT
jgi:PAS domain S-box-containing protein